MSKGAPKGQGQLWTPERIDKLSGLKRANTSHSAIAGIMGVSRSSVSGAVARYLNKNGTVRSYARKAVPRPKYNAPIEELQQPPVHEWRDEIAPARALIANSAQHASIAPITLPRVSIQARDDFSDADVRAGSADRAWTEREMAE